MSRPKLFDYAGELHKRGISTDTHRHYIIQIAHDLRKRGVMPRAGEFDTWQERNDATRRAIVAEIDRRKGTPDAAE